MAKFYGVIGFVKTEETKPGHYKEIITELPYYGDEQKVNYRWQSRGESTNDDIVINNEISIVADDFANKNLGHMRYVEWRGVKWTITAATPAYPRIVLNIGGIYNGK